MSVNNKKKTTEEFIEKANKVHNNKYDYSLVEYINNKTKIKIICKEHGVFEQTPDAHINQKQGCPKCYGNIKSTTEEFVEKANKVHNNKYDYSLVEYINRSSNVKIICKKHGMFEQTPINHIKKIKATGCPKCAKKYNKKKTTEEFIEKANKVHNNKYDYSLVKYVNSNTKVKIICKEHGVFEQIAGCHINMKSGCPKCKRSKGEEKISLLLEENKIRFISQYRFNNCRNKQPLPFDFYLPDYNMCIEFQGEQHYLPMRFRNSNKKFEQTINNDKIKKDYCLKNGIYYLEIRYDENIEKKISDYILIKKDIMTA